MKLECNRCSRPFVPDTEDGWLIRVEDNEVKFLLCPKCGESEEVIEADLDVKFLGNDKQLREIRGTSFSPAKTADEVLEFRKGKASIEFWEGLEGEVFHFVQNEPHLLKITLTTPQFAKMFIQFRWSEKKLRGITIPGDWPSKNQFFNIYQRHRLTKMGLKETGATNKEWTLDISPNDADPLNVALIAAHILQFGVMLDFLKVTGNTSTLDFDSRTNASP